ncbi:NAD(P)/FAD-dependent oxidoreductase, partial [Methanopyrus sp.]
LFVRAVEAGAEVELLACARRALVEDGRVVGVEYESVNGVREVRARVTIAADGIESRVGRTAGLTPPLKPHQICTCAQYEVVGDRHDPKAFVIHFDPDRIPGGYAWVFPKGENRANVGVGIRGSKSRPGSALETLDELIEGPLSELVSGTPVEVNVGGVPVCGPVERSYGDGILLVGDAARQVNPVTGGGLHTALVCGRIAGEVAAEAIEENDTTASFLKQYQDRWKEEFGDTFECARDVAEILPELDLEEVVEFLSSVEDLDELLRTSGILEDVWWD